jgi:XTP/dITP diphosphohydrolase
MRILLATNNAHKAAEYAGILHAHEVLTLRDLGVEQDVDETGTTFVENAILKARSIHEAAGAPDGLAVLADDSGICVHALDGRPGLYSARYGSPDGGRTELPAAERNRKLLAELRGVTDRRAHFVCTIALIMPGDRQIIVQEAWHGLIADQPSAGEHGFGYDPIFYLPEQGCTASELDPSVKNAISHRGRAARVALAALEAALTLPG